MRVSQRPQKCASQSYPRGTRFGSAVATRAFRPTPAGPDQNIKKPLKLNGFLHIEHCFRRGSCFQGVATPSQRVQRQPTCEGKGSAAPSLPGHLANARWRCPFFPISVVKNCNSRGTRLAPWSSHIVQRPSGGLSGPSRGGPHSPLRRASPAPRLGARRPGAPDTATTDGVGGATRSPRGPTGTRRSGTDPACFYI